MGPWHLHSPPHPHSAPPSTTPNSCSRSCAGLHGQQVSHSICTHPGDRFREHPQFRHMDPKGRGRCPICPKAHQSKLTQSSGGGDKRGQTVATPDHQRTGEKTEGFQLDCGENFLAKWRLQELSPGRSLFNPFSSRILERAPGCWRRGLGVNYRPEGESSCRAL